MVHGLRDGPKTAAAAPHDAPVVAIWNRAVVAVYQRNDFVDQVVLVAPDSVRVDVLRPAEARPHVRHDDDHRADAIFGDKLMPVLP